MQYGTQLVDQSDFNEAIRTHIKRFGQDKVAEILGIHPSHLSRLLRDEVRWFLNDALRAAEALQMKVKINRPRRPGT